jgi:Bacterial archaeo-eukaryotic release factor family 10
MTPPAVGLGTLRRLSEMPTAGHPVLSLYLNLDRAARSQPASCVSELDALLADSVPQPSCRESETVRKLLRELPPLPHGARSLALFSCVQAACSAVVPLPDAVDPMAALEPVPWLEPLTGLFAPGGWGAAVLDRSSTRLLRGGPKMLVEFAALTHQLPASHPRCGRLSQLGARRSTRRIVLEHAGRLSSMLLRAHRRRPFERLVLTAPPEMCHLLEGALDNELRARLHRAPRADIDWDGSSVLTTGVTSPEGSWQS